MKKLNKVKNKYNEIDNNIEDKDNIYKNAEKILFNKVLLALKTFGLILLLLIGPSFFVLIFGSNIESFSLTIKVILSLISNLIIIGILCFIYRDTLLTDLKGFFNKNFGENIELAFKYWFLGFLVMLGSNLIISIITNGGIAGNEESVRELIDSAPLYMVFDVAIYAPITEELIFRKSIRDFISNKWVYILVSGIIFGGLHVVGAVESPIDWLFLIPYCSLGIAFASLCRKSNNIFSSMCMHALHNSIAIAIYLFL